MDLSDQIELLWKTLARVDGYIGTTNTKAGLLLGFNTFLLGGLSLKVTELLEPMRQSPYLLGISIAMIGLLGLACMVSLCMTISVVQPLLNASKGVSGYRSKIFFGDIARFQDGRTYAMALQEVEEQGYFEDLARQTHVVSDIAARKFGRLRQAVWLAVVFQCPVLLVLLAVQVVTVAGGGS